jgi:hypothetical protein
LAKQAWVSATVCGEVWHNKSRMYDMKTEIVTICAMIIIVIIPTIVTMVAIISIAQIVIITQIVNGAF